jgi:hypothetical protein
MRVLRTINSAILFLLLLSSVAFGTERVLQRDSSCVTIRDRKGWQEHHIQTVLKGRDTLTTYFINVENFLSYGLYLRTNNVNAVGDSALALSVVYLQSDTTSFFARVKDHSIIDTAITNTIDAECERWYPWYPVGLKYAKFRIYGNAGNDVSDGDSIDVRIYLNRVWSGVLRYIPGTKTPWHQHSYFDNPFDFYNTVDFHKSVLTDTLRVTVLMVPTVTAGRTGVYLLGDWRRQGAGFPDWRRDGMGRPATTGWKVVTL